MFSGSASCYILLLLEWRGKLLTCASSFMVSCTGNWYGFENTVCYR